jgi:hypothetical protein
MGQNTMKAVLKELRLPDFGEADAPPDLSQLHAARYAALMARARAEELDAMLAYGDREHSANLSWLTGFDPRFEEALLIAPVRGEPTLLVGPENVGCAQAAALPLGVTLFPPFGLLGQRRDETPPLAELLRTAGLISGMRVGMAGWKYFSLAETAAPSEWFTEPSYIVDTVRSVVGPFGRVANATALLMQASTGLRAINEIDQLAAFEFAACHTSSAIRRVIEGVRPGMSEFEAARLLSPIGLPLSCHTMLSSGPRASFGLGSPGPRVIERGDPLTVAYGVWGALNCRAGFLAGDEGDLPEAATDYVERLVRPYFEAVAAWYQAIAIGVTGAAVHDVVHSRLGNDFFGVKLNPGHLIHIDEWMNTPIYGASEECLLSGQALQLDIIPATGTPYFTSNVEDGIALLDQRGQAQLAEKYPALWHRINARRSFVTDSVGIRLHRDVLLFSNIPIWLTPYMLSHELAMVVKD